MLRIYLLLAFLLVSVSCGDNVTDPPYPGNPSFRDGFVVIKTASETVTTEQPFAITTSCSPLIPGKGRFILKIRGEYTDDTVYVINPVADTIWRPFNIVENPTAQSAVVPFATDGSRQLGITWIIRFPEKAKGRSYQISSSVHLDSVMISGDNNLYHFTDPATASQYPYGIVHSASSRSLSLSAH